MVKSINETVLLYNMKNTDKGRKIKFVLIQMGVRIKNVEKEDYLQTIGALVGENGFEPTDTIFDGDGFQDEMLVMKGFSSKRVDEMLLRFRKSKIEKVKLKAILTPSNTGWTSLALYKELKEEHEQMSKEPLS